MTAAFDQAPRLVSDSPSATNGASSEVVEAFSTAIVSGDADRLAGLMCDDVVYQLPGPGPSSLRHTGRVEVVAALTPSPAPGVSPRRAEVTEVIVEGRRAVVIVLLSGTIDAEPFAFETAFHLAIDGRHLAGITEYSGNQHVADQLVNTDGPSRGIRSRLLQRWRRQT